MDRLGLWLEGPREEALDILVLQEVAGLQGIQRGPEAADLRLLELEADSSLLPLMRVQASEDSELNEYIILGTHKLDSHLGQVILLDEQVVDFIISGSAGKRSI